MVAVVTGNSLGLVGSSGNVLGGGGQLGNAVTGLGGDLAYVNAATGNLSIQRQDELLLGLGPDIGIVRTYNSQGTFDFDNNDNWQISLYRRVFGLTGGTGVNTAGSTVKRTAADGAELTYTYDTATAKYINKDGAGSYDTLTFASNVWTWQDGDSRIKETYEVQTAGATAAEGTHRIKTLTDTDGNALTYTYNNATDSLITQVTSTNGERTELIYNATKQLTQINVVNSSNVTTTRVRYTYENATATARLTSVSTDLSPADGVIADGKTYTTTYTYDGASKRVASITNSDGTGTAFTYDGSGRVLTVTDGTGNVTTFAYPTTTTATITNVGNNGVSQVTTLTYDVNKQLTRVQGPSGSGQDINYLYDANGNVTQMTDSRGNVTKYTYDANGNQTRQEDAAGNTTTRSYSATNQLLTETTYVTPDTVPGDVTYNAALPQTTRYAYDVEEHLRFIVSPEGRVTEYRYNTNGTRAAVIQYTNNLFGSAATADETTLNTWVTTTVTDKTKTQRTDYSYDVRGQLSARTTYSTVTSTGLGVVDSSTSTTQYVYDQYGNLTQKIDARAGVASTTGTGPVAHTPPVATGLTVAHYADTPLIDSDVAGNVTSFEQAIETSTPTTTSVYSDAVVANAQGDEAYRMTGYVYMEAGHDYTFSGYRDDTLILKIGGITLQSDGYNTWGDFTSPVFSPVVTGYYSVEVDFYNANGDGSIDLNLSIDGGSPQSFNTTNFKIYASADDFIGQAGVGEQVTVNDGSYFVTQATNTNPPSSSGTEGYLTSYSYDGLNRLISQQDAEGNIITTAYVDSNRQVKVVLSNGLVTTSTYDLAGRLVSVSNGQTGTPASLGTTSYLYDALGLVRQSTDAAGQISYYLYDTLGRKVGVIDANHNLTEYVYNNNNQIVRTKQYSNAVTATLDETTALTLTLDTVGVRNTNTTTDRINYNIYDAAGRLAKQINTVGAVTEYQYDGASHLIKTIQYGDLLTSVQMNALAAQSTEISADDINTIPADNQVPSVPATGNSPTTQPVSYQYYRFTPTQLRSDTANSVQLSELAFLNQGVRLTAAAVSNPNGDNPVNEAPDYANDDQTGTKWLDFNKGALVYDFGSTVQVDGYYFETANDGSERDPIRWVLEGSHDGVNWEMLDDRSQADQATPTTRFTAIDTISLGTTTQTGTTVVNSTITASDRIIRQLYSADGLLVAKLDSEGYLTEYLYDGVGQHISTIRYGTQTASAQWANGDLAALRPATAANDQKTYNIYNARGQLEGSVDPLGYLTEYQYDVAGNLTNTVRYATAINYTLGASVAASRPAANAEDQSTTNTYDGNNRIKSTTSSPDGLSTEYTYDSVGNLTQQVNTYTGAANTEKRSQFKQYDLLGRVTRALSGEGILALQALVSPTQTQIDTVWDSYGTRYTYDLAGRVIVATAPNGTNNAGNKTLYYYDKEGKLQYQINALGEVIEYGYNSFDQRESSKQYKTRLTAQTLSGMTGGFAANVQTEIQALASGGVVTATTLFDNAGRAISLIDALNNTNSRTYNAFGELQTTTTKIDNNTDLITSYTYDGRGLVTATTEDATGLNRITQAVYDAFGRITQTTDGRGSLIKHAYDKLGREVTTTDALNSNTVTTYDAFSRVLTRTDGRTNSTTYSYDSTARTMTMTTSEGISLITEKNRYGETVKVTDGRNHITTYTYNADGQLKTSTTDTGTATSPTTSTTANDYDAAGHLITTTDARGTQTTLAYDAANRVLSRVVDPTGLSLTTNYTYDALGRQSQVQDANGIWTYVNYDNKGQVTSMVVDPSGLNLTTSYTYDARGKRLTVTEGAGTTAAKTTQYVYDKLGRLTSSVVDPGASKLNITTSYTYDKNDNVVLKTNANGNKTVYSYDANNRLIYTVDALGNVTKKEYDENGNITRTTVYATALSATALAALQANPSGAVNVTANVAQDQVAKHIYDKDNRNIQTTDALGFITNYTYDASGNQLTVTEAFGTAAQRTTTQEFDAANRKTAAVDALGNRTETTYDAAGNIVTITDALGNIGYYYYDAANRMTVSINPEGAVTEQRYDALGNIIETIRYANPVMGATVSSMPEIIQDNSHDQRQVVSYDAAGRKATIHTYWGAGGNDYYTESFSYDAIGNIESSTARNGATTTYTYDAVGRKLTETLPVTSKDSNGVDTAVVNGFAYDSMGNLITKTEAEGLPEQRITTYSYDNLNRLITEHGQSFTAYNPAMQANEVVTPTKTTTYDSFSNILTETNANGNTRYSYYDQANRLTGQVDEGGVYTQFNYDVVGNKTNQTVYANKVSNPSTTAQPTPTADAANDRTTFYTYDGMGRQLTSRVDNITYGSVTNQATGQYDVTTGSIETQTAYDALGNVIKQTDANGNITRKYYNKAGEMVATVDAGNYLTTLIRDGNGNITRETRYANQLNLTITNTTTLAEIQAAISLSTDDRATQLSYDRLGRVTAETIKSVEQGEVNATNGVLTPNVGTTATVTGTLDTANLSVNGLSNIDSVSLSTGNISYSQTYVAGTAPQTGIFVSSGTSRKHTINLALPYDELIALGNGSAVVELTATIYTPAKPGGTVNFMYVAPRPASTSETKRTLLLPAGQRSISTVYDLGIPDAYISVLTALSVKVIKSTVQGNVVIFDAPVQVGKSNISKQYPINQTLYIKGQPQNTDRVELSYRVKGSTDAFAIVQLPQVKDADGNLITGMYAFNYGSLPQAEYEFYYQALDIDGNVINEQGIMDIIDGHMTTHTSDAVTRYEYDGLNNIIQKTDATNVISNWVYDGLGRKISQINPEYIDFEGDTVRPITDTEYNGLNEVVRELKRGKDNASETDDHITTYTYTNGRLTSETDATGAVKTYGYDANGNITQTVLLNRTNADGASTNDVTVYSYDALNRQIKSQDISTGLISEIQYNSFNQITGKRSYVDTAPASWTEFAQYDQAGRAWKSNSGDGITKVYVYDANGNATLTINGTIDMRNLSLTQVLAQQATDNTNGVKNQTFYTMSVYDSKNQLVTSIQPNMVDNLINITDAGNVVMSSGNISYSQTYVAGTAPQTGMFVSSGTSRKHTINLALPYDELIALGNGSATVELTATIYTPAKPGGIVNFVYVAPRPASTSVTTRTLLLPSGQRSISTVYDLGLPDAYISVLTDLSVKVIKSTDQGDVVIFNAPVQVGKSNISKQYPINQTLYIKGQPVESTAVKLYYREKGSQAGYTMVNVPQVVNNVGTTLRGMFAYDYSGLAKAQYEFYYQAVDVNEVVLNEQRGEFNTQALINTSTLTEGQETVSIYANNNIIKTGGSNAWGDADAYSVNAYTGSAYVSARAGQIDKNGMFGLNSDPAANKSHTSLDYAWYTDGQDLRIYINNVDQGVFGIYNADDVLAVKYEGTTVSFLKNGVVINPTTYTTAADRTFYFDSSLYSKDYALRDIQFGADEASATAAVLQQSVITKTGGTNNTWGDAESRSNAGFTGEAYVSGSAGQTNLSAMFGLTTDPTANQSYNTIDYAWYLYSNGNLYIYENGSNLDTAGYGEYKSTDVLAVKYSGTTISYLKNGTVIKSHDTAAGLTLYYDSSFYSSAFSLKDVQFGATADTAQYISQSVSATQYVTLPDASSSTPVTILRKQSYNAFGEIASEIDGNGHVTNFSYNTMGKLNRKTDPTVSITKDNGQVEQISPVTEYTYDAVGRVIAFKDANGNLNMQAWMAGAPEGAEDMLTYEHHADGGTKTYLFDIYGNKRQETNEVGQQSQFKYDAMDRLLQTTGYVGNQRYSYDAAGNRISHLRATDSTLTSGHTEKTYYDSLGRVRKTTSYMDFATTYDYQYQNVILGLDGIAGSGWRKTVTQADGKYSIDDMDMFNRITWHQDLGGHQFTYNYNSAGWLMNQTGTTGQNIDYDYYQNGFIRSIHDKAIGVYTYYEYDGNGNKTYEAYATLKNPVDINAGFSNYYQQTHVTYDALNRIDTITDPKATIHYTYDAVGNRRSVRSDYYQIGGTTSVQELWYKYDNMNRFLITMGSLVNGAIVVGNEGVDISYNVIGQRVKVINGNVDPAKVTTEVYGYTNEGYLNTVKINGVLRSFRENDAYGRVWRMTEYNGSGAITYKVTTTYDKDNRVTKQVDQTGAITDYQYYTGGANGAYATTGAGELAHTVSDSNGATSGGTIVNTHYAYEYWDEAKVTAITAAPYNKDIKKNNAVWRAGYSDIRFDVNGHMTGAIDRSGNRNIRYVTDAQGKILLREEITGIIPRPNYRYYGETYNPGSAADKVNRYIYVDGQQVGEVNNTGPSRVDYVQSMAARKQKTGNYAGWKPISSADFDQSYEPISPTYPGPVASTYTVRNGDTLQSIAQTLWGDSSLWYILADVNGLTALDQLVEGVQLTVPNKVTNVHNNASTFRPYNPGEAIGDLNPTIPAMPKPPKKKHGCGGLGMIVVAIVTVAVAIFAPQLIPAIADLSPAVGAMAGAALGNVAGQVTGNVLGVQHGFNFGSFATSVLSAGITEGVLGGTVNYGGGVTSPLTELGEKLAGMNYAGIAARAVVGNVINQGVGNLTGQQKGFSWSSVAISGVGATAGAYASNQLGLNSNITISNQVGKDLGRAAVNASANALTQLAVNGGRINWQQVASDTIVNFASSRAQSLMAQQRTVQGNTTAVNSTFTGQHIYTADNRGMTDVPVGEERYNVGGNSADEIQERINEIRYENEDAIQMYGEPAWVDAETGAMGWAVPNPEPIVGIDLLAGQSQQYYEIPNINYINNYNLYEKGVGYLEAGLTIGSGFVGNVASGVTGLSTLLMTGNVDASVAVMDGTRNTLTYTPRTNSGQQSFTSFGQALKPIGDFAHSIEQGSGDFGYGMFGNSPLAGALFSAAPDAALMLFGPGGSAARSSFVNVGKDSLKYTYDNLAPTATNMFRESPALNGSWANMYVVPNIENGYSWLDNISDTSAFVTRYDPLFPGRPNPAFSIDTTTFSSGVKTAEGGLRNSAQFWKAWSNLRGDSLSADNIVRSSRGVSPIIDKTWVEVFPEHVDYIGESLLHHHVNFGKYAIPVPKSTHTSSSGIWHMENYKGY